MSLAATWKSPESHNRQQTKHLLIYPRDHASQEAASTNKPSTC